MRLPRPEALLPERVDELRGHAELGHAHLVRVVEQDVRPGMEGRAVVEDGCRLARQRRRQPVPHHPPACGVVEGAVARPDVRVQPVLLQVREEDAARPVDDALGNPGRARGEEDVEGMVERKPAELDLPRAPRADEVVEPGGVGDRRDVGIRLRVGDDDHALHRRETPDDLRQAVEARVPLPLPEVAIGRQEDARFDLPEAVEHALHAEVGRGGRDRGPEARRGEHVHDGLRHVGHVAGHPVARLDSERVQRLGEARRRVVQLGPGEVATDAVLGPEEERRPVVPAPEQVLRVVQPRVRIPARPRQAVEVDDHALAPLPDDAAEVPHRVPERRRLADRPAPQRLRGIGTRPARLVRVAREARHVRLRGEVRIRRPQRTLRPRRARRASGPRCRHARSSDTRQYRKAGDRSCASSHPKKTSDSVPKTANPTPLQADTQSGGT